MKKKNKKTARRGKTTEQTLLASPAPASIRPWTNNILIHSSALVLLIIVLYAGTLNAPFQWDENYFIVDNPIVKDFSYFVNPSDAKGFNIFYGGLINRYVGYLTFALNYKVNGLSVAGYHIVNIAIHIANAILVYFLVLLTFRTPFFSKNVNGAAVNSDWKKGKEADSRFLIAFFSSILFAAHPMQTEAVTYVFQRFASLAAFFYLLSLTAYIKFRLETDDNHKAGRWTPYAITLLSAVLAMKTKENTFTLPIVIMLYEFLFFSPPTVPCSNLNNIPTSQPRFFQQQRFLYLAPILVTLCIIPLTLMRLTGEYGVNPGLYGAKVFHRDEYLFTQLRGIVTYLRLLFFPVNQNIDYNYPVYRSFFNWNVLLSFLFLLSIVITGVYCVHRSAAERRDDSPLACAYYRMIAFGIFWFFITISVESSIIPIPMLFCEYRSYLPSVGIFVAVTTLIFMQVIRPGKMNALQKKRIAILILFLAVIVLSAATVKRNELWTDKVSLWTDAVSKRS